MIKSSGEVFFGTFIDKEENDSMRDSDDAGSWKSTEKTKFFIGFHIIYFSGTRLESSF